jgi:RND family efflux transporter MFP subunit
MKVALKIIIPIAIIVLAIMGFKFLGSLKPEPKSQQPPPIVPIVKIITVSPEDHAPPVKSFGTVSSYFETALTPQVSGRITYVSEKFRVGETIDTEHLLVKIDPTDYEAALATETANLTIAERTFAEEEIRAEQAAGDWKASGRDISKASDFVLRKPQLAAAQASIESAKATIARARADLDRTEVRSPFPAIITARDASPGNQASPQASLGTLVSTEKVEIRLPLTADQISRITLPASAELTSPLKPGTTWDATLVRMEPVVDQQNQVIFAVAEVEKPFDGEKPPLAVGIFANASITANPLEQSYRVLEAAFVNDSFIWSVDADGKLKRIEAQRLYSDGGHVFLKTATEISGELKIISRPLSNFLNGTEVKIADEQPNAEKEQ